MNALFIKVENISDEKYNEILQMGWKLVSVDNFSKNRLVYSFVKNQ